MNKKGTLIRDVYTNYVIHVSALTSKLELSFFDGGTFVAGEGKTISRNRCSNNN